MVIRNTVGGPATGGDFFDRTQVQKTMWRSAETDNILLLAPRRVGKTSLLRRLEDTAEEHGYRAVYVSISHQASELEFLRSVFAAIEVVKDGRTVIERAYEALRRRLPKLSLKKVEVADLFTVEFSDAHQKDWQLVGEALITALRDLKGQWLVMVDEMPRFVLALLDADRERARVFLNWFRDVRIDRHAQSVRWVLCGSIGLDTVAKRARLGDTINDLKVVRLGAFEPADANALLAKLAQSNGVQFGAAERAHALTLIGWLIPYHVQLLFSAIVDAGVTAPTVADVGASYATLLSPSHKHYFDYWAQRLHDELGAVDAGHAMAVLAVVAADDAGTGKDTLRTLLFDRSVESEADAHFLLDVLETDGYLVQVAGRFVFRSPLLRDYWRARIL